MPLKSYTTAVARPSIREIATSILSPSKKCHARSIHLSAGANARMTPISDLTTPSMVRGITKTSSRFLAIKTRPPPTQDRGPQSSETTQTDFGTMDIFGNTPVPTTSIDACLWDGFHLNNGVKITEGAGVLLIGGEAFAWRPWGLETLGRNKLINKKGQFEVGEASWGVFGLVWPKPDLLILGVGTSMVPLAPSTRKYINSLGIRVELQDTRNAAAQFNLLATERGIGNVAAALIPMGWRENVGVQSSS